MNEDIEEITPDMYRSAQKNYMNSKEGFISNLKKSYLSRVKEVGSLGKKGESMPYPGSFGGQLGQILGRTAVDAPVMAASSLLGPAGLPLLAAYGYATSPGETSAEKAEQALFMAAPSALGKVSSKMKGVKNNLSMNEIPSAPEAFSALQDMFETIKKPEKIQSEIEGLKGEISGANLSKKQKTDTLLSEVEPALANKEEQVHGLESFLENKIGEGSHENLRNLVSNEVKSLEESIGEQNKKNYAEFHENFGEERIKNPINTKKLDLDYGISQSLLKRYPDLKPLIDRLSPKESVNTALGQSSELNHTTGDYLNLYRALRDTVSENRKQSVLAIGKEKNTLLDDAKKLAKLRDEIKDKKIQSLSNEGKKALEKAQNYYKDYVATMKEHAPTQSILESGKVPNNYFDTLNQPGMELIRKQLLNNPSARNALGSHSIIGTNFTQMTPNKIIDFLKTDKAKLLDNETRNALAQYAGHKHDLSYLKKLKTEATKARIKEPDRIMRDILHENPSLEQPFKNLRDMQEKMRTLENQLIQKGLDKAEADKAASKYWKIVSVAKTAKMIKHGIEKIFRLH